MYKIMIIDDQPLLAKLLIEDLSDEKYLISQTINVDDIYDDLEVFMPDIILLDICLDGIERWDILQRIKLESPHIPILIMGSYPSIANDPRLGQADGYIIKDIYMDKVKDKLKEMNSYIR